MIYTQIEKIDVEKLLAKIGDPNWHFTIRLALGKLAPATRNEIIKQVANDDIYLACFFKSVSWEVDEETIDFLIKNAIGTISSGKKTTTQNKTKAILGLIEIGQFEKAAKIIFDYSKAHSAEVSSHLVRNVGKEIDIQSHIKLIEATVRSKSMFQIFVEEFLKKINSLYYFYDFLTNYLLYDYQNEESYFVFSFSMAIFLTVVKYDTLSKSDKEYYCKVLIFAVEKSQSNKFVNRIKEIIDSNIELKASIEIQLATTKLPISKLKKICSARKVPQEKGRFKDIIHVENSSNIPPNKNDRSLSTDIETELNFALLQVGEKFDCNVKSVGDFGLVVKLKGFENSFFVSKFDLTNPTDIRIGSEIELSIKFINVKAKRITLTSRF